MVYPHRVPSLGGGFRGLGLPYYQKALRRGRDVGLWAAADASACG